MTGPGSPLEVAVLIPCYNEQATVGLVIDGFRSSLPDARIFVFDNASTDETAKVALAHGAEIRSVPEQGKGNVVRRMFADVDADVYVLVDGDATYDPSAAPALVDLVAVQGNDLVNARRLAITPKARNGHTFGNRVLTGFVGLLFGQRFDDMLSGYKAMSKRCVKSFPVFSAGFDVETELTVHALGLKMAVSEISAPYVERPEGSISKLKTVRDGILILRSILRLLREVRPLAFFTLLGLVMLIAAGVLSYPIVQTYFATGLVPRFPTAFMTMGLVILAVISVMTGLILETSTRGRQEAKTLCYLAIPGPLADEG